jgi:parallel beta-helix repeat protein
MRLSSSLAVGSPMARVAAIVVATLLLAATVAGAGVAGSRLLAADGPIVVDPDGNGTVTTITEAVAMAVDGDTILIKPGTYDESVTITKDITISGDGDRDSIIVEVSVEIPLGKSGDGPDLPTAFRFDGSDATLEGLTVRGEASRIVISGGAPVLRDLDLDGIGRVWSLDAGQPTPTGLQFNDGSAASITDSVLTDLDIDIETASSASILNNEFSVAAIWMEGMDVTAVIRGNTMAESGKWAISVNAGAQATIEDNTIANARVAVEVTNSGAFVSDAASEAVIRGNTVSDNQTGISVSRASATISENELDGNENGITVNGSDALVTGNVIRGEGRTGVLLSSGGSPTLEESTIEGYDFGLLIGSGTTPTLTGNTICDNGRNLLLAGDAEMPDTTGNEICEDAPEAG